MSDNTLIKPLAVRRKQTALLLGEGTTKVDELVALGKLDGRKSGKNLLITMASIEAYLDSLPRAELKLPRRLTARAPSRRKRQPSRSKRRQLGRQ